MHWEILLLGCNCVGIHVESRKLEHLAPSLVEDGEVAVEDVEEPADDVLVRAGSVHKFTLTVMDILNLGMVIVGLFRISWRRGGQNLMNM